MSSPGRISANLAPGRSRPGCPYVLYSGHGGGDYGIVRSFVNALRGTPDDSVTTARESLESHLLAFAAEEARVKHSVVEMDEYHRRVNDEARRM